MKLGTAISFSHNSPEEWAKKHKELGLSSVVFPCSFKDGIAKIDAYKKAADDFSLCIAEVGAWKNILSDDKKQREENFAYCKHQLELADYIGALCCVNISGAKGPVWDGGYIENYSERTYEEIILSIRRLIDETQLQNTFYTLEPMPWMHPDSPEDYLKMIKDIDRERFGVHMDMVNMISDPQKYLFAKDYTVKAFELLGKHIKSCHIKDVALDTRLTVCLSEVPMGEGGFPIPHYINEINKLDIDMPVIIEHLSEEDEYLKAIGYLNGLKEQGLI